MTSTLKNVQLNHLIKYEHASSRDFKKFSTKNYQVHYCTGIKCATSSSFIKSGGQSIFAL